MVITVTLAAWAMPKMDRAGDIGTGSAANRLVAALQYAQVLAQRQGVETQVLIAVTDPQIKVKYLSGAEVALPNENYDNYWIRLHGDVSITGCGTPVVYKPDGTLTINGSPPSTVTSCLINQNGETRFTVKIEPTGHAYLVS